MASGPGTLSSRQCQEPLKPSSAACTLPRPAPCPLLLALMLPQTCLRSGSFLQRLPETTPPSLRPHPCTRASATEPRGCWSRPLRSEAPCPGDPAAACMPPSRGPGRLVCSQTRRVVKCEGKRGNQVLHRLPGEAELKGQAPRQTSRRGNRAALQVLVATWWPFRPAASPRIFTCGARPGSCPSG